MVFSVFSRISPCSARMPFWKHLMLAWRKTNSYQPSNVWRPGCNLWCLWEVSGVLSHSPIMSHMAATRGVARLERQRSAMNKMMLPAAARNSLRG